MKTNTVSQFPHPPPYFRADYDLPKIPDRPIKCFTVPSEEAEDVKMVTDVPNLDFDADKIASDLTSGLGKQYQAFLQLLTDIQLQNDTAAISSLIAKFENIHGILGKLRSVQARRQLLELGKSEVRSRKELIEHLSSAAASLEDARSRKLFTSIQLPAPLDAEKEDSKDDDDAHQVILSRLTEL